MEERGSALSPGRAYDNRVDAAEAELLHRPPHGELSPIGLDMDQPLFSVAEGGLVVATEPNPHIPPDPVRLGVPAPAPCFRRARPQPRRRADPNAEAIDQA